MTSATSAVSLNQAQVQQKQQSKAEGVSGLFKSLFDGVKSSTSESMDAIFEEAASIYGISSSLLKAVARAESNFNPQAVSHAGALGVMQLMPSTASSLGVSDPFDARQNILGGAKYLKTQLERFGGDVSLALAAYNAGPGSVEKYGGVPPYAETQNYVKKVVSYMDDPTLQANTTVRTGTPQAGYESSALGSVSDQSASSGYLDGLYTALKALGSMGSLGGNPAAVGSIPSSSEDSSSASSSLSSMNGLSMLGSLYGMSSLGSSGISGLGTIGSQYGSSALSALSGLYGSSALGLLGNTSGTSALGSYGTSALAGLGSSYGSSALTGTGSLYGMSSVYGSSADMLNLLFDNVTQSEDGETVSMDKKSYYNLVELLRMQMMNAGSQISSAVV